MTIIEHFYNAIATAQFHCHLQNKNISAHSLDPVSCIAVLHLFKYIISKDYVLKNLKVLLKVAKRQ